MRSDIDGTGDLTGCPEKGLPANADRPQQGRNQEEDSAVCCAVTLLSGSPFCRDFLAAKKAPDRLPDMERYMGTAGTGCMTRRKGFVKFLWIL